MILVTGGSGFIGSNFILDWLASTETGGESIINLDKLTYAGNLENLAEVEEDKRYIFIQGDISDRVLIDRLLVEYCPRAVLNFAAESHVDRSINGPGDFIQTNIVGTFCLLEAVRCYWQNLSSEHKNAFRFLQVSTDEVYGSLDCAAPAFTEYHQYQPNSPYSASKAASDHLVRAWNHTYNLPVLTTHCSNNYGPYQFPEKLIPLVIKNALAGDVLPIYGDGLQVRDWLYVQDHCRAIQWVLREGRLGNTYNIGGCNEKTNVEIVHAICELLDEFHPKPGETSYAQQIRFVKDRPGHDRRYAIDARKIEKEIGWKPIETFESGIRKTVRWYLKNQEWIVHIENGEYRSKPKLSNDR